MEGNTLILGAGMTGLAAGLSSGHRVFEAAEGPGGICMSYYMRPGDSEAMNRCPEDGEVYRFENGGGHWIFGGDPTVLRYIGNVISMERYERRSSVYFPDEERYVPYPIQNNLRFLERDTILQALDEMARPAGSVETMDDWLRGHFGATLSDLFFAPFHALYTAGLYQSIAPQDAYKSPVNLSLALGGALRDAPPVGYNTTFVYPRGGLNQLAERMARQCDVAYGRQVTDVDVETRTLGFADGSKVAYGNLLSTLPLNRMMELTGVRVDARPDPFTSVLVVNIGAVRGDRCPDDHWLYIPRSLSGFHRVGFYSNVDAEFLPASARGLRDRVSIYVERAYEGGARPDAATIDAYCRDLVGELQAWGFIGSAEVVHPTWVDVAYTWSWPGSQWTRQAMAALEAHGIYSIGRYGRWVFQGIADSLRDGFVAGGSFR